MLTPGQITAISDACARVDTATGEWAGRVRDRLLWELLAETGLRLAEALSLQHRDWHTGRGGMPFIEVVPRELPHGVRVKGGRKNPAQPKWTAPASLEALSCRQD